MGFVESDHAIVILARPGKDLVKARIFGASRAQRRIGDEENAFGHRHGMAEFPARERLEIERLEQERRTGEAKARADKEKLEQTYALQLRRLEEQKESASQEDKAKLQEEMAKLQRDLDGSQGITAKGKHNIVVQSASERRSGRALASWGMSGGGRSDKMVRKFVDLEQGPKLKFCA